MHGCVDTSRTSLTSPLHGVLVQVACAAPTHPEPFSLCGLGSSPPVQLPECTRDNARDAGSLVQPVLCTAYWLSHVSDQPPYMEYWSRLPVRHLPILSPSAYVALAPLLQSNSLHAPGGTMLEMLGRSSNQFSARHTGPGCLRVPLLILSPSACATVAHLFPSSSLPRTRKDSARDAGFPSRSLSRT